MPTLASLTSYEYEAGTCTLRLVGQLSALSQLSDKPVLTRSRFQLQLWESDSVTTEVAGGSIRQPLLEVSGQEPQLSELAAVVRQYVQTYLQGQTLTLGEGIGQGATYLAPVRLTRHRLEMAESGTPARTHRVELSTLQLADLADVLEQVDRAVERRPEEARIRAPRYTARPRLPLWIGSVAAVAVAAVLGSQWLTTTPVSVRSPTPTAETAPDAESFTLEGSQDQTASMPEVDDSQPPPATSEATSPEPELTDRTPVGSPAAPSSTKKGNTATAPEQPNSATPPPGTVDSGTEPRMDESASPQVPQSGNTKPASPAPSSASEPSNTVTESAPIVGADQVAQPQAVTSARTSAATTDAASASAAEWLEQLRTALQEQWQPPAGLSDSLRYTLTLAADGTVSVLQPLTDLSRTYQAQPTLPQVGSVIPNLVRSQPVTVEVQFLPSGEVIVSPSPVEAQPQDSR
jgi:hypothetical protein